MGPQEVGELVLLFLAIYSWPSVSEQVYIVTSESSP